MKMHGRAAFIVCVAVVVVFGGGADCAPDLAIAEAADCCECLGDHGPDSGDAAPSTNCLPDDISQGFDTKVEVQQCAADAGDAIAGSDDAVHVSDAACLDDAHVCAAVCAKAEAAGVSFDVFGASSD